jgi:hypothetical protein
MQNAIHKVERLNGAVTGIWRLAIMASLGGLAVTVLAAPVSFESSGLVPHRAYAASENSNAGGNGKGKGPESAPGQQKNEDFVESENTGDDAAKSALAESGEQVEQPTILPIAEDGPATTNVIKEIAGLAGDAELSEEEELEAIRNGWGTWRTADGPETVIAQ